jgi:hypothetical protein
VPRPGVATVIASRQILPLAIAVDDTRVYWSLDGGEDPRNEDEARREQGVIRSCQPDNCAGTVITYATGERQTRRIAVAGGKIYWLRSDRTPFTVVACPVEGCNGGPEIIVESAREFAVGGTSLFWFEEDSQLGRCSLSDCPNTRVMTTVSSLVRSPQLGRSSLAVGPTHLYWIDGDENSAERGIMMMPKDGSRPPRALVTGLHLATSIVATATRVVWAESYSLGQIRSCPLLDCSDGPTTIVSPEPYPASLAAEGAGVYWFHGRGNGTVDEPSAVDLLECGVAGCEGTGPNRLMSQPTAPSGTAANRTHVYWLDQGGPLDTPLPPTDVVPEGFIKRIRRTR